MGFSSMADFFGCRHRPSGLQMRVLGEDWLSVCKSCGRQILFRPKCGWVTRGIDERSKRPVWARPAIATFAAATIAIPASIGAKQESSAELFLQPTQQVERAEISAEFWNQYLERGQHCRSPLDGSNPSAVSQITGTISSSTEFRHIETALWQLDRGRHQLVMVYSLPDLDGKMEVLRVRGWIDGQTCVATLSPM